VALIASAGQQYSIATMQVVARAGGSFLAKNRPGDTGEHICNYWIAVIGELRELGRIEQRSRRLL
jgi:hypothetical protein